MENSTLDLTHKNLLTIKQCLQLVQGIMTGSYTRDLLYEGDRYLYDEISEARSKIDNEIRSNLQKAIEEYKSSKKENK